MADNRYDERKADLPPQGDRNADPITDAPGAHPIETGIGAALGGAAAGAAVGAAAGPIGVVAGTIAGAVAGGYAGKGVGEYIDPTLEDEWCRDYVTRNVKLGPDETYESYRPAYHYGVEHASRHEDRRFEDVEPELRSDWEASHGDTGLAWDRARGAARDAWDRTCAIRKERGRNN